MKHVSLTALVVALTGSLVFSTAAKADDSSVVGVVASPSAGGSAASSFSIGSITFPVIAASAVAVGVAAAVASNSGGKALPQPIQLTQKCEGSDKLLNGVCEGTRVSSVVTVTGTGTSTTTVTVPVTVTFTYAPKLG